MVGKNQQELISLLTAFFLHDYTSPREKQLPVRQCVDVSVVRNDLNNVIIIKEQP